MHYIIVLTVLTILYLRQVTPVQAACKKPQEAPFAQNIYSTNTIASVQDSPRTSLSNSSLSGYLTAYTSPSKPGGVEPAQQTNPITSLSEVELESLRLEYYKYKIISQLGITTNPDQWQPQIRARLRRELVSSFPSREQEQFSSVSISSSTFVQPLTPLPSPVKISKTVC